MPSVAAPTGGGRGIPPMDVREKMRAPTRGGLRVVRHNGIFYTRGSVRIADVGMRSMIAARAP